MSRKSPRNTGATQKKQARAHTKGSILRRILPGILVALGLALAGLVLWLFFGTQAFTIALHDLDPSLESQIQRVCEAWGRDQKIDLKVISASGSSLQKFDAVLLSPGLANKNILSTLSPIPEELSGKVSITLRWAASGSGKLRALPLALDTSEFAWSKSLPQAGKVPAAPFFSALTKAPGLGKQGTLVFPGGDDSTLADLAGLLVLESGGYGAYAALCDLLSARAPANHDDLIAFFSRDLGGTTMAESLQVLLDWKESGMLHSNWLDLQPGDCRNLIAQGQVAASLQTLAFHRSIDRSTLQEWGSAPLVLPGIKNLPQPNVPALQSRIFALGKSDQSSRNTEFSALAAYLSSAEGQLALCSATGLAPAVLSVQAQDLQANEARGAASGSWVVQGLSKDAFASGADRTSFAADLRMWLRSR